MEPRLYYVRIIAEPVAWSVGLSVTVVSPAKTAEPIEMLFGFWARMDPKNHVRCPDPPREGTFLSF